MYFLSVATAFVLSLGFSEQLGVFGYNGTHEIEEGRAMMFPSLSTLQASICTSSGTPFFVPKKKYPFRRLGVNIGVQFNYNLPYRLKDFYKFPYWARAMTDIVKGRYLPEVTTPRAARKRRSAKHLSAGDIYVALEEVLQFSGYDEDCVVKSVCELAHSPFHNVEEDFYAEIIQFLLTPTEHQAFDVVHERKLKNKYELAEILGKNGADCNLLYPKCRKSFLTDITGYVEENKLDISSCGPGNSKPYLNWSTTPSIFFSFFLSSGTMLAVLFSPSVR